MKYYITKQEESGKVVIIDEAEEVLCTSDELYDSVYYEPKTGITWARIKDKYQDILDKKILNTQFFKKAEMGETIEIKKVMRTGEPHTNNNYQPRKKSSLDDIDTSLLSKDEIVLLNKLKGKLSRAEEIEKLTKQIEKTKAQLNDLQNKLVELEAQNND